MDEVIAEEEPARNNSIPIENAAEVIEVNNMEEEDDLDEEDYSDDEEGSARETWLDVKELKKMTLNELRTLRDSCGNRDGIPRPRLDPQITKVIVRRLPPQMTIDGYLKELSEIPKYNYIRLLPQNEDIPSGIEKRSSICINFESEQEAFWFKEKYNNTEFFDDKGNSFIACVDFSFFQGVSQSVPPVRDDAKRGTLEESDMFKDFLKAYKEDPSAFTMSHSEVITTPDTMLDEILNKKTTDPDNTPLLQYLHERTKKKEAARQDREQRRKERDLARKKLKEEAKRKQKEKEETARRKQKEKEKEEKRKANDDGRENDGHKDRDRRRERDRERQRERDRQRRLRKENKVVTEKREKDKDKGATGGADMGSDKLLSNDTKDAAKSESKEKSKPFPGTITYSRSGNATRWSENSGPRKQSEKHHKDDHKRSQEELKTTASESSSQSKNSSTSEKLPTEKEKRSNESQKPSSKETSKSSAFGKPFPVKDQPPSKSTEDVSTSEKKKSIGEDKSSGSSKKEAISRQDDVPKKKIVKKIIKVKKVVKEGTGGDDSAQQQDGSDTKPKKVVRVIRKTSKTDDGSGASSKPSSVITKKKEGENNGGAGDAATSSVPAKGESEKEWKNRKGRPEIQIYRPGSLRAGASKPSASTSGNKDRGSSDNVSHAAQSDSKET